MIISEAAMKIGTVRDHVESIRKLSTNDVLCMDCFVLKRQNIDLSYFDVVVFHYSIIVASPGYLPQKLVEIFESFLGPKLLFIQDEYRWVNKTTEAIRRLGVDFVFTVVNENAVRKIYHHPWLSNIPFETTLTGFVPEHLTKVEVPEYGRRPIDVSYRARKLPAWCGSFGQEKWKIGDRFSRDAAAYGLSCDICSAEGNRIYGKAWINFIANSKAVLGTESGSSFIDFDGQVMPRIDEFVESNPDANFEELDRRFLEGRDGLITIRVISPRCFEAAALRTLMILYPGNYSGILSPNRHYVPLERDHSNMDDVVEVIRDQNAARAIIDRAFREIACSDEWTFAKFVQRFDQVIAGLIAQKEREGSISSTVISESEFQQRKSAWKRSAFVWGSMYRLRSALAHWLSTTNARMSAVEKLEENWVKRLVLKVILKTKPLLKRILLGRSM